MHASLKIIAYTHNNAPQCGIILLAILSIIYKTHYLQKATVSSRRLSVASSVSGCSSVVRNRRLPHFVVVVNASNNDGNFAFPDALPHFSAVRDVEWRGTMSSARAVFISI